MANTNRNGAANTGFYATYVMTLAKNITAARHQAKREGIISMSLANLRQMTRFPMGAPNANFVERAWAEALEYATPVCDKGRARIGVL